MTTYMIFFLKKLQNNPLSNYQTKNEFTIDGTIHQFLDRTNLHNLHIQTYGQLNALLQLRHFFLPKIVIFLISPQKPILWILM